MTTHLGPFERVEETNDASRNGDALRQRRRARFVHLEEAERCRSSAIRTLMQAYRPGCARRSWVAVFTHAAPGSMLQ